MPKSFATILASLMAPLLIAATVESESASAAESPEYVFHGGKVATIDASFRVVQAMAVRGDRILAVGTDEDVLKLAGPETRKIDLQGRFVIPGLIDSHVHASGAAVYEFDHPIPDFETVGDVLAYIRARAEIVPEGEWILLNQVFVTRLRDQRFPSRKELDEAAPKHPVAFRTGPDASLNSLALQLSGITREFKIEDGLPGKIERDESGEPTGIVRSAGRFIKSKSTAKSASPDRQRAELKALLADYNAVGITGIAERSAGDGTVKMYESLREANELTCRVFLNWSVDPNGPWEKVRERILAGAKHPAHAKNDWVWLRGVKVFLDGGMLTGSAYMREPWGVSRIYSIDDPAYKGTLLIEPERMYEIAKLCLENELQVTAHAVGDGATEILTDVYARIAEKDFPVRDHRPCLTHANFLSLSTIQKMAKYGVVADLQPVWLLLDGATLFKQFGEERTRYFQPYKSLEAHGVVVGGGSDHMQKLGSLRSVNPYNPFLGMWTVLTRLPRWTDKPLHAEEIADRQQMLRLYTIRNAFLLFDEQQRGSLEAGKLADFAILDRDLLSCPADDVRTTRVLETWVGGKRVYERTNP
jgi:predicted amidohydrolase YtcJ